MHYMLLGYLIKMDAQEQDQLLAAQLETELKMHLWIHDPERYEKVFGSRAESTQAIARDEKIDWTVPESRDELQALAELGGFEIPDD